MPRRDAAGRDRAPARPGRRRPSPAGSTETGSRRVRAAPGARRRRLTASTTPRCGLPAGVDRLIGEGRHGLSPLRARRGRLPRPWSGRRRTLATPSSSRLGPAARARAGQLGLRGAVVDQRLERLVDLDHLVDARAGRDSPRRGRPRSPARARPARPTASAPPSSALSVVARDVRRAGSPGRARGPAAGRSARRASAPAGSARPPCRSAG